MKSWTKIIIKSNGEKLQNFQTNFRNKNKTEKQEQKIKVKKFEKQEKEIKYETIPTSNFWKDEKQYQRKKKNV